VAARLTVRATGFSYPRRCRPLMNATVALVVLVALLGWCLYAFNRLVRLANLLREAWSGIDVQLKRRHDLVPSLVDVVKAHAGFERGVLEEITRLRSTSPAARATADLQDSENALTSRLKSVLAVAEAYPELRASRSYLDLQTQLVEVEDQLQMARRYYNGTVRDYNIAAESFPSNLIAGVCRFSLESFFQVDSATERQVPKVNL
jgi:LemA protein